MLDKPASHAAAKTSGPLAGFRIVEFAGIGPGPFACMMLADMGAEVVTLDRVGASKNLKSVAGRGRKVVELDLKDKAAVAQVLDLLTNADALIEGFRPGVMERLGLGPDVVHARNPRLNEPLRGSGPAPGSLLWGFGQATILPGAGTAAGHRPSFHAVHICARQNGDAAAGS